MSEASDRATEFINRIQNGENPLKTAVQGSEAQPDMKGLKPTTFGLKSMNEGYDPSNNKDDGQ